MANDLTTDQQQLQSTIDELYQKLSELFPAQRDALRNALNTIQVGDNQTLGMLAAADDLASAPAGSAIELSETIKQAVFLVTSSWGGGTPGPITTGGDLNSFTEPGFYYVTSPLNGPADGGAGYLSVQKFSGGGYALQSFWRSTGSAFRHFERRMMDGDWESWKELWHTGNSVAVETGKNSNGIYQKTESGILICSYATSEEYQAKNSAGASNLFFSDRVYLTFPHKFIDQPYVAPANVSSGGYFGWGETSISSTTQTSARACSPSDTHSARLGYIAIGRWK